MTTDSLQNLSNLTLCDYFAVVGFDKATGIQVDKLAELSSDFVGQSLPDTSKFPLDCSYEAKVLCHFPAHREGFPFAYEISALCMPKGLKLYTEKKVPKEPNFHSFILVKEDGTRVNGCSLIFYEPLLDSALRQQIYDMQMEYIRQTTADDVSRNQEIGLATPIARRRQTQVQYPPGTVSSGVHTLPRKTSLRRSIRASHGRNTMTSNGQSTTSSSQSIEFWGKGMSDLPNQWTDVINHYADSSDESPRRRQHRNRSHSSHAKKRTSFYDSVSKPIFVSKCICFVTRAPIVYTIENLLRSIWSMIIGKFSFLESPVMPVESIIYWALHEIPLPLPGTSFQIKYGECNLVVRRPSSNELPLFDYPMQIIFEFIPIERFIKLYTCFMLEHQILICSKYMDRLMLIAECLSALIFPFRWQLTYVPILPYSQLKFIEAPVPYLMGLCYDDKIPDQIYQSNVCILDIDKQKLDAPEDIPAFPRQREIAAQIQQIRMRYCPQLKTEETIGPNASTSNKVDDNVVFRRNVPEATDQKNKKLPQYNRELWTMKRMSRSFDNNMTFAEAANTFCETQSNTHDNCGSKISEITNGGDEIMNGIASTSERAKTSSERLPKHVESYNAYFRGLKFNRAIRELFLCNVASLFASYEHFLINTSANEQENRESVVNFDKASFLSDQPESYLPFLAAFLETQMFTSFVDAKILAHCQAQNEDTRYIHYFDRKIAQLINVVGNDSQLMNTTAQSAHVNHHAIQRTPVSERPLDFIFMSASFAQHQAEIMDADLTITTDYEIEMPHQLSRPSSSLTATSECNEALANISPSHKIFPELHADQFELLTKFGTEMDGSVISSPWRQQHRKQRVLNVLENAASRLTPNGKSSKTNNESPIKLVQQNKKFVDQLLKETKTKTKRMLVAKMGKEAVHLGHGDLGITGVEENTLVAGLCDLLERIWAHGLKKKQGKSALWCHIFAHYDREKLENCKPMDRYTNLSPGDVVGDIEHDNEAIENDGENAKTLNELLESIRSIAKSIELMPIDGFGTNKENLDDENENTRINLQKLSQYDTSSEAVSCNTCANVKKVEASSDTNNNYKITNSKWQNSLFNAANFIYDKIDKMAAVEPSRTTSSTSVAYKENECDNKNSLSCRGRTTERRSNACSESSDGSRESRRSISTVRDESKPRFYHHEDEYSKRLRHASRQRRADAAAAAMALMAGRAEKPGVHNYELLEKSAPKQLPQKKKKGMHKSFMHQIEQRAAVPFSTVAPSIEDTVKLAKAKFANVTRGNAFGGQQRETLSDDTRLSSSGLHKSSSISDLAPHWKGNFFEENEGGAKNVEMSMSMAPGETRTLGRPVRRQSQQREPRKRSVSRSHGVFSHRGNEPANGFSDFDSNRHLLPLPTNMAYDLKNIMRMTEIKTDIGFARAFVRLALERKLLHKHLKAVLSDTHLLQKMYKRYAFLRCEEEHEQFLYHILSLNAVDFSCFTHTFISTKIRYEVALVASIDRFSSSSIWIMLGGSLGSTSNIYLPSNSLQFKFDFKNLGVLSTLRIGHSAGEKGSYPSKWYLDYVLVRNNITAQTYSFNCGRWFGRGVDDGALERLLVAESLHFGNTAAMSEVDAVELESGIFPQASGSISALSSFGFNNFMSRPGSPVSTGTSGNALASSASILSSQKANQNLCYSTGSLTRCRRSTSVGRSSDYMPKQAVLNITDLQHKLGMAVNALVKHFFTEKDYRSSARLTLLLCGENGLVPYLEQVFEMGRQDTLFSNRFFRQLYPWDYIERVFAWFANFFRNGESQKLTREQRSLIIYAYNLVVKIGANNAVGKEGKFHHFVLLTLRDHILSGLLPLMAWTPVTMQIYEESSFLRQSQHLSYLSELLNSLNEFNFTLEKSLIYGIEL